jgi:hypothetical protein
MKQLTAQRFRKTYQNMYTIFKDENNKVVDINRNHLKQLKFGTRVGIVKGVKVSLVWEEITE